MADALAHLLKQFLYSIDKSTCEPLYAERLNWRKKLPRYLDSIMTNLKKMMLGYENEIVQGLFKSLELVAKEIVLQNYEEETVDDMLEIIEKLCNIRYRSDVDEAVSGFNDEVEKILDQLTGTSLKQLQIISIAGMAGLGKTTLARKIYSHPLIEYMFDYRAWTSVSQVYHKRDMILGILSSFINDLTEETYKMSKEQLGEKLYRLLKGRKYLVVLDDIWDSKAWNDLKVYLPDDKTGSRVLFTSRDIDLSLHVGAAIPAHVLRLRTEDESWDIFQKKLFRTGICPFRLKRIGRDIAEKCEGLPLALVIAASLVKNKMSTFWWSEIAESLSSFIVSDPSQYMETLNLSYNHLPPHLRPCFLFFGSFPENYEVPVTKLIWLWISQGFIHQTGCRTLEDAAEDFLMDLIKRSLLMTAKKRADGQIKTCRIHDLLRDFCLRKSEEENFVPLSYKYAALPEPSTTVTDLVHEMYLNSPAIPTHYGLCYPFELGNVIQKGGSILSEEYKYLGVLDVESVPISVFPCDVIQLANLRYLAMQVHDGSPQASISNLVNLQMLIILSRKNIILPKTIWNMVNLRHLYIKSGVNLIEEPFSVQMREMDGCMLRLSSLQTLSQVSPHSCYNTFSRTPNLRKLGFCGPLMSSLGDLEFPKLGSLQHLRKLKLFNTASYPEPSRSCNPIMFPENLKQLTLSNTGMDWEEMWTFSLLPSLEVLKLKFHACIGERWETSDAEFQKLKILKLHGLNFRQWICSRDNFPCLQRLVVHQCLRLNGIPLEMGKILTLEVIEVRGCSLSTNTSALKIQEEQESQGDCFLKVHAINNLKSLRSKPSLRHPR